VISHNTRPTETKGAGVIITGVGSQRNQVIGNYIGTNVAGNARLGSIFGVHITEGASDNIIGDAIGGGNLISGNFTGVVIDSGAVFNKVMGNKIGLNAAGDFKLRNARQGVLISEAPFNTIGGMKEEGGNVISGNQDGIVISGAASRGNKIQGNIIGLGVDSRTLVANTRDGIVLQSTSLRTLIGGSTDLPGQAPGNIVAGNGRTGIWIQAPRNWVEGNTVGTNHLSTPNLGNGGDGILVEHSDNAIGTSDPLFDRRRNVISGNLKTGITITGANAVRNVIKGNYVGTNVPGRGPLGNALDGIFITGGGIGYDDRRRRR